MSSVTRMTFKNDNCLLILVWHLCMFVDLIGVRSYYGVRGKNLSLCFAIFKLCYEKEMGSLKCWVSLGSCVFTHHLLRYTMDSWSALFCSRWYRGAAGSGLYHSQFLTAVKGKKTGLEEGVHVFKFFVNWCDHILCYLNAVLKAFGPLLGTRFSGWYWW